MSNPALLRTLRSLLASLYPEETSARRLVADAELDARHITFSGQAINTWHAILSEAVKTDRLQKLLDCVQDEYGTNPAFQTVYTSYTEYADAGGRFMWPLPSLDGEEPPAPGESPYKGLQYFDTTDAALFFGRERLTAELVAYLCSHRFLAVVGASGSGKSSLVRAGVVPALQRGQTLQDGVLPPDGSTRWHYCIMTPTAHPLEELAAKLTHDSESVTATATLLDDLGKDARSLHLFVRRLVASDNRLLLVVDQFEELFTLCRDPGERKAFVDNLLTVAVDDGVTTVVITLRADFYAHCFAFDNLRAALEGYQKNIGLMNQDELRQAIELPAQQEGWDFESGLVDLLLHDVGDEPGALPLLSHALLETWKRRRGRTLTLAGYVESGRVQGAIAQTAESVFTQKLTAAQQTIAKNIFLRLTELGEGAEDTRRRVQLSELMPHAESKATIEAVLKTLADARLVTTDTDEVEVAHEALIREWPQLRQWLAENRESLRMQRTVGAAAKSWAALKQDAGALYSGLRLQQALAWQRENAVVLTPLEAAFLRASKQRRDLQRGLLLTVAVAIFAVLGWLSWGQVNEIRYDRAMQAVSPLIVADDAAEATAKLQAAAALFPDRLDFDAQIANVNRQVATQLVQAGEIMARNGDYTGADAKFKAAFALNPPSDTPIYVWIAAGPFTMGSTDEDEHASGDEMPAHTVDVAGFWIGRTEVTNAQYLRCIAAKACEPPPNERYANSAWANHPVANVTWFQAKTYAEWVGGRLPTEAEWEKACRGTDKRLYPWGNEAPTYERANFYHSNVSPTAVGSYPAGANGLYDMAGNLWEWTSSKYQGYPYDPTDGREDLEGRDVRTLRGGSWDYADDLVRCASRLSYAPVSLLNLGFRLVVSSPDP
jgi:formylglycine-generating enzyme required for sulfatase activity